MQQGLGKKYRQKGFDALSSSLLLYALAIIGTSAFAGKSKIFDFKHCAKQEDNKDIAMVRNYS
jgi:hypothetical protein